MTHARRSEDCVPTDTEQFKLECLARHAIRQRDPRAFLDRWGAKHGDRAEAELRALMRRAREEHKARREEGLRPLKRACAGELG